MQEPDVETSESERIVPPKSDRRNMVVFIAVLIAYVVQTQTTQFVQTKLGYSQPYFIFYVAHSSFTIVFPLHLLYVTRATGVPASRYLDGIKASAAQLLERTAGESFPLRKLVRLVTSLTIGATVPAVMWYISVAFSPISDVAALFNTNAFWAYVISVILSTSSPGARRWEPSKLWAVSAASVGVFFVLYGGGIPDHPVSISVLFGDALALASSFSYGLYQVLYNRYAVPPSMVAGITQYSRSEGGYEPLLQDAASDTLDGDRSVTSPPFGLFANFLTSSMGITTAVALWIPLLFFHFDFPSNGRTWGYIALISGTGLVYNAGIMILLGVWGPIVTSVGNLLTVMLVFLSDHFFGDGLESFTVWRIGGCLLISGGFFILTLDISRIR